MSRDDVLRELELLPMWKLRMPKREATELAMPVLVAQEIFSDPNDKFARVSSIAKMDWDALQKCVKDCKSCNLATTRIQTVFGVGGQGAEWLFVGDAPDVDEDKQGEPFVGQAGKLLDNMLAAIDLKRGENVYIAYALKCKAPQNIDPYDDEIQQCASFLKRQVALIQPKLIVALGKLATQSLLNTSEPMDALRGKLHEYESHQRIVPVVVTYAPDDLLRNLPDKAKAWEDLQLAEKTMKGL